MNVAMALAFGFTCWFINCTESISSKSYLSGRYHPSVCRLATVSTAFSSGCIPFMIKSAPRHSSRGRSHGARRCFRSIRYSSKIEAIDSGRTRGEYLSAVKSIVATVSLLAGISITVVPKDAVARTPQKPVVEALVQLPNEESDWKKLLGNAVQGSEANMLILATREGSEKPVLGATITMDKITFPVMMQLFPKNVIGGARWPGDFEGKSIYDVQVTVCQGGKDKGVTCGSPALVGSGESFFVSQLEDVPEVAESGGVRVPATVVLSPTTNLP